MTRVTKHIGAVGALSVVREVTLGLDVAQYASADVLADTQKIENALRIEEGSGIIQSLVVLDKDDQGAAFDVVFLKNNVSIGTENATILVTDDVADEILGVVEVAAADYVDLANSQVVTKTGVGLVVEAAEGSKDLYVAAISRGTGTYTGSGITLKIGILQD